MLKRLSIILLALALVVVTTKQMMPCAMAMTMDASSPMSDAPMPCKGMTPPCLVSLGCAVVVSLPGVPVMVETNVRWVEISYPPLHSALSGRSVEPELFPPIVTA